jgi:hypothetical protein
MSAPVLAPWPYYADDEIAAVTAVLRSGQVNYRTGPEGKLFESEYTAATGAKHALTVANGTAALELALQALEIGPGDEVIVPARTFIATASAVVRSGATPVVADVDLRSQNLNQNSISAVLSEKTKAIIPVHLAGWPADMDSILSVAKSSGLFVIEDCAQAHGALYKGQAVGTLGDVGCFSFCQDKIITTGGEGGLVLTNDQNLYERMWSLRDHGWDYQRAHAKSTTTGFKWLVDSFATNWRMTEMQSAIGRAQLQKLDTWVTARRKNARALTAVISNLPLVTDLTPPEDVRHSYYKYYVLLDPSALKADWTRDRILGDLNTHGIPAGVGACPDISNERAFSNLRINTSHTRPNALTLADRTLMLPVHPTLTDENIQFIAETLASTLNTATR